MITADMLTRIGAAVQSLVVLAIRLALFFIVIHTNKHTHT